MRVRVRLRKLYGGVRWRKLKGIAEVRLPNGTRRLAEVHWYESHGVGRKEFKIKLFFEGLAMQKSARFAICVRNVGVPASLELRKVYRLVADAAAASQGLVRVVDESGEDYLYPDTFFVPIEVPKAAVRAFAKRSA